ncbi:Rossmann-like and DUF2520 domain-containing protein [Bergeriella denitrificans]|uniref:Uncharacterized conserved protein n=1 Tax=Bergeriella denitrificans TaxID=494 RepID=A0A378UID2_BERDE|nr:Rossmann-like and DUF2520 domain-containing protein [Bergeriella denitrificans]STZ77055.1 Uncharacterized conserved protein [Bergeriella denitrificans]
MKKIFHIIGAGRVGQTLAALLGQHAGWQLSHIVSRSLPQGAFGAAVVRDIAELPYADVVFVATPDNAVVEAAARLAASQALSAETLVLHLSGAKTIHELVAVKQRGALTGSLHPVFAFADAETAAAGLHGSLCALEADSVRAEQILRQIADALGLQAFTLPSQHKARYHAALSAASNFSVALAAYAQDLLAPLDIPEALSRRLVGGLLRQTADNLTLLPPAEALTGPIVRGDDGTVAAHLAALDEAEQAQYRLWAQAVLTLASVRLDAEAAARVRAVLGG